MKLNIVPASSGIQWVKLGVQTFLKQPLALAGLFFMYTSAILVLSIVPFLGPILGGMLVPAATLGLMAATAEATKGKFPMPSVLLSAFRAGKQRARAMLVLGVIYTVASMSAWALGSLLGGPPPATPATTAAGEMPPVDAGALFSLLLHIPLFVLFWHAPALVHWHGVTPTKSLFFSAVACLRNIGAFLMYVLAWSGVFFAVALLLGTLGLVFGGAALAKSVMFPTALLLASMFSTSIYFTFRDSFLAEPEEQAPDLPPPENPTGGDNP